jgi:hypothetical protein
LPEKRPKSPKRTNDHQTYAEKEMSVGLNLAVANPSVKTSNRFAKTIYFFDLPLFCEKSSNFFGPSEHVIITH